MIFVLLWTAPDLQRRRVWSGLGQQDSPCRAQRSGQVHPSQAPGRRAPPDGRTSQEELASQDRQVPSGKVKGQVGITWGGVSQRS